MLNINGKKFCEHCFSEIRTNDGICHFCSYPRNNEKYPTALSEGSILAGRYVVGRVLGKGGFGITYLCYDSKDRTKVAIKEYLPDSLTHRNTGETSVSTYGGESEEYFKMGAQKFYDEAKLVSRFNGNPNIISVYEFFYENNTTYFVMEYLDGKDLKHYVKENSGRIIEEEALYIAQKVTEALMIIHSTEVLHRDISPDNIFLCNDGNVKLIDFGAARQVIGEASKSLSVILKQGFAPLEQYQKRGNQGPWTDIYALGASLYYGLTGQILDDAMTRITDDNIDLDGISPEFAAILRKMLAVRIEDRYQNTFELKSDLSAMLMTPEKFKSDAGKIQEEEIEGAETEKLVKDEKVVADKPAINTGNVVVPDNRPVQNRKPVAPVNNAANVASYRIQKPQPEKVKKTSGKKKVGIAFLIVGIISSFFFFIALIFLTMWLVNDVNYLAACSYLEDGIYDAAVRDFEELDDYKDSKEKLKEAKYHLAYEYWKDSDYEEAIELINDIEGYIPVNEVYGYLSEDFENERKYQYVMAHKDNDNTTTYEYLKDLKWDYYKDSEEIYEELYSWEITDIFFNASMDDTTNKMISFRKRSPLYIHFTLTGGTPDEEEYISYVVTYPDGNKSNKAEYGYTLSDGDKSSLGWKDGIINSGKLKFSFYDEKNNLIGTDSVYVY